MKKVLSVILALAMLLGCSLTVFAKEPCEEPGCTGEVFMHRSSENVRGYIYCPQCGEIGCTATKYVTEYICNECDVCAYTTVYYRVLCDWCYYFNWYGDITPWNPNN